MAASKRELRKLQKIVDRIVAYKEAMASLSDAALRNKTWEFRRRLAEGGTLEGLVPRQVEQYIRAHGLYGTKTDETR